MVNLRKLCKSWRIDAEFSKTVTIRSAEYIPWGSRDLVTVESARATQGVTARGR